MAELRGWRLHERRGKMPGALDSFGDLESRALITMGLRHDGVRVSSPESQATFDLRIAYPIEWNRKYAKGLPTALRTFRQMN